MATKVVKEEVIRARVDKDFKYRLKKMCKDKKISMSKLIINILENEVNKYEFKIKNEKEIKGETNLSYCVEILLIFYW